jgi:membrane-bound lytic murein transglycosylase D
VRCTESRSRVHVRSALIPYATEACLELANPVKLRIGNRKNNRCARSLFQVLLALSLACCAPTVRAQNQPLDVEDLVQSAEQWAQENLDQDILRSLQAADRQQVEQFLVDLRKDLNGEYVLDLGKLKETAKAVIPLLEQYEETYPYAVWLKARLDYIEVADQLRSLTPPPKQVPGEPPKPLPNPSPRVQREIWIRKLASRPWPPTAKSYVDKLKPVFAAQHVPPELVWVAEVESSFDPRARSPEGAAGLFQLMPQTAKRFGLRTWPLDQRLKSEPSATAAAKYLRYLFGHYKDWRLALAAYNAGEGRVDELLKKQKAHSYDAIARRLPAETQLYVPKLEATLQKREGLNLGDLKLPKSKAA